MLKLGMDILVNSLYEVLMLFPYLFFTYLLMEYLEHKVSRKTTAYVIKAKQYGPVVGAILGLVPQCGFSVVASNLYATGLITLGTMLAVFLSTSDEMLPILIYGGVGGSLIVKIITIKLIFSMIVGFLIDSYLPESFIGHKKTDIKTFCQQEKCKCDEKNENIYKSAYKHTEKISLFILIFALIINTIFALGGEDYVQNLFANYPILSKFVAAIFGLIPSCYPSVLMSQLFLENVISISTLITCSLSNAGVGLLVLYRVNTNKKETLKIISLILSVSVLFGLLGELFLQ